jgi:hypothetical protein
MPNGPFLPAEFVPTEFSTSAEKAAFGNALLHFLDADCPRDLFTKKFYNRLSMTFGNIAHYNLEGFYDTWFTRDRHRLAFVQKILRWPCHGDPKFTFSDVENAVQRVVRERSYLARLELRAAEALRVAEMSDLERLEAKYRTQRAEEVGGPLAEPQSGIAENPSPGGAAVAVQINLF